MAANKTKKALLPKLRFKGFDNDWINKKLGDIAEFQKGKGISKSDISEEGKIECIRYGELYTHYSETIKQVNSKTDVSANDLFLSEYNDVIIPASGETQIDIAKASCVLKAGVALGGDLNIIRSKMNGIFLSYYLNSTKKFDIARLAQGSSVMHLYSGQLKSLKLHLPTLPEQQKIAAFLSAVDDKIQLLTRKKELLEQYKKGVMQQLFSGKLRFKAGNGKAYPKWVIKRLGEVGKFISGVGFPEIEQGRKNGVPFYKVSDMNILGNEFEMNIANNYLTVDQIQRLKFKPIIKPALIFAKVGAAIFLERKRIANNFLIDNNMMAFLPNGRILFFKYIFEKVRLSKYAQVGALPSYNASDLSIIKIKLPINVEEEEKIANFLFYIDNKIETVSKQITQTQTFKKGLLQQMFV